MRQSQQTRGLEPWFCSPLPILPIPRCCPEKAPARASGATADRLHLRRHPQAFSAPWGSTQPTAMAVPGCLRGRRQFAPFSPQVRWGDDGARRGWLGPPGVVAGWPLPPAW